MIIYHNPRCSKSRIAKKALDDNNLKYQTRLYLDEPLNKDELIILLNKLSLQPQDIIRTKEAIWKENFKTKEYNRSELIAILVKNPKLIERPIIENKNTALIARDESAIEQSIANYSE